MRSFNLLRVAAEAELLRLRAMLVRQGRRAAFGAIAVIFGLGVLVLGEVAGWQVLRLYVAPIPATLILLGINLAIAAVVGGLAARSAPGPVEREALRVRRQAVDAARGALTFTAALPVATTSSEPPAAAWREGAVVLRTAQMTRHEEPRASSLGKVIGAGRNSISILRFTFNEGIEKCRSSGGRTPHPAFDRGRDARGRF